MIEIRVVIIIDFKINLPMNQANKSIQVHIIILIIFSYILSACSTKPVSSMYGSPMSDRPIYRGPDVRVGQIGTVNAYTPLKLIGRNGDSWVAFEYNGNIRWIQSFVLDIEGNYRKSLSFQTLFHQINPHQIAHLTKQL